MDPSRESSSAVPGFFVIRSEGTPRTVVDLTGTAGVLRVAVGLGSQVAGIPSRPRGCCGGFERRIRTDTSERTPVDCRIPQVMKSISFRRHFRRDMESGTVSIDSICGGLARRVFNGLATPCPGSRELVSRLARWRNGACAEPFPASARPQALGTKDHFCSMMTSTRSRRAWKVRVGCPTAG